MTVTHVCACGCEESPKAKKSRFVPGHDAQLKARLYRSIQDPAAPAHEAQAAVQRLDELGWRQPAPKKARAKAQPKPEPVTESQPEPTPEPAAAAPAVF